MTNQIVILASMIPATILAAVMAEPAEEPVKFGVLPAYTYACYDRDSYKRQKYKHFFSAVEILAGVVEGCTHTSIDRPVIILEDGDIVKIDAGDLGVRWTNNSNIQ